MFGGEVSKDARGSWFQEVKESLGCGGGLDVAGWRGRATPRPRHAHVQEPEQGRPNQLNLQGLATLNQ